MRVRLAFLGLLLLAINATAAENTRVTVEIPIDGSSVPLRASVNQEGGILLEEIPANFSGYMKLLPELRSHIDLSESGCKRVENILAAVSLGGNQYEYAYQLIRQPSPAAMFRFNLVPFALTADLAQEIGKVAQEKGLKASTYFFKKSNLQLLDREVSISFDADALSRTLGELDDVEYQLDSTLHRIFLKTGEVGGELSYRDVLCDLVQGKAKLSVKIIGGKTREPPLAASVAKDLRRHLDDAFPDNVSDERARALIVGYETGRFLEKRKVELTKDQLFEAIDVLLSESMIPVDLSEVEIEEAFSTKTEVTYTGMAHIKLKRD